MDFFLYEILARVVAAYLFVDCIRTLRRGLAERKIRLYNSDVVGSILMAFMDPSLQIVQRDTPRRSATGSRSASRYFSCSAVSALRSSAGFTQTVEFHCWEPQGYPTKHRNTRKVRAPSPPGKAIALPDFSGERVGVRGCYPRRP
jgi:hypothetical protein